MALVPLTWLEIVRLQAEYRLNDFYSSLRLTNCVANSPQVAKNTSPLATQIDFEMSSGERIRCRRSRVGGGQCGLSPKVNKVIECRYTGVT